jgi:hypothetical protein
MNQNSFKKEGNTAANAKGTSVTLTGINSLLYKETRKEGERSIKLIFDTTFALDAALTYLIKVPEKLTWIETGSVLSAGEFSALKENVAEALIEFEVLGLFVTKRSHLKNAPNGQLDAAYLASLLSEGN